MSVTYRPHTIQAYHEIMNRLIQIQTEEDRINKEGTIAEWEAFQQENWEDLRSTVEPPPINALIFAELMESYEPQTAHIAEAFKSGAASMQKDLYRYKPDRHPATKQLAEMIIDALLTISDRLTVPPKK